MVETIIQYIQETYAPSGILVYGSYANGTNSETSDFDALVITEHKNCERDNRTRINGVLLDLVFCSPDDLENKLGPAELIQLYDGVVVLDRDGVAQRCKERVVTYVDGLSLKTQQENEVQLAWCEKMLDRAARGDAEGLYRHHWLLIDSLEIYCDLVGWRYFGPKKMLARLQAENVEAATLYTSALSSMSLETLAAWVTYLRNIWETNGVS